MDDIEKVENKKVLRKIGVESSYDDFGELKVSVTGFHELIEQLREELPNVHQDTLNCHIHQMVAYVTSGLKTDSRAIEKMLNGYIRFVLDNNPSDLVETMLVIQMIVTHDLFMKVVTRANNASQTFQATKDYANLTCKTSRLYVQQMDSLEKYRRKGQQTVNVNHLNVEKGGKAYLGKFVANGQSERDDQL